MHLNILQKISFLKYLLSTILTNNIYNINIYNVHKLIHIDNF